jgi:GH25 family lysozyme M1 (1,4-beta-N-acetylmuramidase)
VSFVFVKATEGRTYVNPKLSAQTKRARDAGCVVGFYHFLWPGNLTAQAEYFVSKAPEKAGDILAVDWETTGDGTHASNAEKDRFIRKVKELRPNNRVVLYANRNYWLNVDDTSYAGDGLWIADYVTAGKPASRPSGASTSTPTIRWTRTWRTSPARPPCAAPEWAENA